MSGLLLAEAARLEAGKSDLSASNLWETDPKLFKLLQAKRRYTIDAAANTENHLLPRWYGPGGEHLDFLTLITTGPERLFLNPPYNGEQGKFVAQASVLADGGKCQIDVLVPVYSDTAWWQDYATRADYILLLRGRLSFYLHGKRYTTARFPSALLMFDHDRGQCQVRHWDWKAEYVEHFGGEA